MFTVAIDLIVHHIWDILHSKNGESASGQHPYIENRRSSTWSDALSRWLAYNCDSFYLKQNTSLFYYTLFYSASYKYVQFYIKIAIWNMKIMHILIMMNVLLIRKEMFSYILTITVDPYSRIILMSVKYHNGD